MTTKKTKRPTSRKKTKALKPKLEDLFLSGLRHLVQGVAQVGGTMLLVMLTPEEAIEAAGGDVGEAISGHRCGPECWHAIGNTKAERQAWWDEKMKVYQKDKKAREDLRKRDWRKSYRSAEPGADDMFEKTPEKR